MKRSISLLLVIVMLLSLIACGEQKGDIKVDTEESSTALTEGGSEKEDDPNAGKDAEVTIKFANNGAADPEHPQNKAMYYFKDLVEEKSGGKVYVEVHIAGSLGDARTIMEGVQLGTIEMGDVENGVMSGFVPEAAIWDLPYLFTSLDHAHKVLDGEVGQKIAKLYEDLGVKHLAYNDGGFRYFTNNKKPIASMADLSGLKMRVMESKVMIASMEAFGASPVPISFQELYTALQQGTVDGQENPLDLIYAQNYAEVQKYLSLSEHFYYPRQYIINQAFLESLDPEIQKILEESAVETAQYQRDELKKYTGTMLDKLKDQGMEITEFDKTDAIKAAETVYPEFYSVIGGGDETAGEEIIRSIMDSRD